MSLAAIHEAVSLSRTASLADAYLVAWEEWAGEDAEFWDVTAGDGITDTPS